MIKEKDWKWFGHAGHFICAKDCRFHLTTQVGNYLVSTVGEMWGDRQVREIHAQIHSGEWFAANKHRKGDDFDSAYMRKFGFQEIGYGRKYETMAFKAGKPCQVKGCGCGLPAISGEELDFLAYNDAQSATKGHLELCKKWSKND